MPNNTMGFQRTRSSRPFVMRERPEYLGSPWRRGRRMICISAILKPRAEAPFQHPWMPSQDEVVRSGEVQPPFESRHGRGRPHREAVAQRVTKRPRAHGQRPRVRRWRLRPARGEEREISPNSPPRPHHVGACLTGPGPETRPAMTLAARNAGEQISVEIAHLEKCRLVVDEPEHLWYWQTTLQQTFLDLYNFTM